MGCDPSTCLGLCNKAMSGFCIDGFVGRFTAAHFGEQNAGSPLNVLMLCIQPERFLVCRTPAPLATEHTRLAPAPPAPQPVAIGPEEPAQRCGLQDNALHSVVWVDDTVFTTTTPPHPPCAGLVGGCLVCSRAARGAQRSQAWWHQLAVELGLGLSTEKRPPSSGW